MFGPVEAGGEDARRAELEALDDVAAASAPSAVAVSAMRGTCGKALVQHRELQVFGAEIVAPLRDAMRLVDGEEREARSCASEIEAARVSSRSGAT